MHSKHKTFLCTEIDSRCSLHDNFVLIFFRENCLDVCRLWREVTSKPREIRSGFFPLLARVQDGEDEKIYIYLHETAHFFKHVKA
jgi:hypothetical protein